VQGKDVPYVSNEAGVNRYVWDFGTTPPVKWEGAGNEFFKGPPEGLPVGPGHYYVRLTLGNRSYTKPIAIKLDPLTAVSDTETNDALAFGRRYYHELSQVDVMLNAFDKLKKELDAASADAKKKNDTAVQAQIDSALQGRSELFNAMTADYKNFEDFIQRPGKLREDIGNVVQSLTAPVTPAQRQLGERVDVTYRSVMGKYNAYARTTVPALNAALQKAGLKPVTSLTPLQP
jgi:hypothetical protein